MNSDLRGFEAVIGLEVHARILTRTKMFCGCSAAHGLEPNTSVCPVCLGLPGALPVVNREALRLALVAALALEAVVSRRSVFARKNYFYPDLPKGYQISQYEEPLARDGRVTFWEGRREVTVAVERIHLEEDAGKSFHLDDGSTGVDFNRCGVPLLEIVSAPGITSAHQAHLYLARLRQVLRYAAVCAGDMELGDLRCDANVSVRRPGQSALGVKTEIKNLNSFRSVERGLDFEIGRQIDLLERGSPVRHQTLMWDAARQVTVLMRTKEEADDYRYFPEPDLVPVHVEDSSLRLLAGSLPELPHAREKRLASQYGIPAYDAGVLAGSAALADLFEATAGLAGDPRSVSSWILTEVLGELNRRKTEVAGLGLAPAALAELLGLVHAGRISGRIAKEVFAEMVATGKGPGEIVQERGLFGINDAGLIREIARRVVAENPSSVEDLRRGKERAFRFLVGKVMEATGGRADPETVRDSLRAELKAGETGLTGAG